MKTGYKIFEISKDRYWIKTASGEPLWVPLNHRNQGLPKKAFRPEPVRYHFLT